MWKQYCKDDFFVVHKNWCGRLLQQGRTWPLLGVCNGTCVLFLEWFLPLKSVSVSNFMEVIFLEPGPHCWCSVPGDLLNLCKRFGGKLLDDRPTFNRSNELDD
jgi:hypothetical protein